MKLFLPFFIIFICLSLVGCETARNSPAPVCDIGLIEHLPKSGKHRVQHGETLYSIAWRYGLDYRFLAKRNHIYPPFHVLTGQVIYLKKTEPEAYAMKQMKKTEADAFAMKQMKKTEADAFAMKQMKKTEADAFAMKQMKKTESEPFEVKQSSLSHDTTERKFKFIRPGLPRDFSDGGLQRKDQRSALPLVIQADSLREDDRISSQVALPLALMTRDKNKQSWNWPARGNIIGYFSNFNKGLNIEGRIGDPIFATASGRVVYSGYGLRRYGNMIIIKHNNTYLTAYAHNSKNLVKEGDWIQSRQLIALMGNTGSHRTMLHFEIRQNGKPVNPLKFVRK